MKRYKVQWAFGKRINQPSIFSQESAAEHEVAHLVGSWIPQTLQQHIEVSELSPAFKSGGPEIEKAIRFLVEELPRLVSEGRVWEAFDMWEQFYQRFENEFGYPLFLKLGTVIVEGSEKTGLKNRFPILPAMDNPTEKYAPREKNFVFMSARERIVNNFIREIGKVAFNKADLKGIDLTDDQFNEAVGETLREIGPRYEFFYQEEIPKFQAELREGILKRLFQKSSIGLGAFQTWVVQYADIGGAWCPGRHSSEGRAKEQAREHLETLTHSLDAHVQAELVGKGKTKYTKAASAMVKHLESLLERDLVWRAYHDFRQFQDDWSTGLYFPLEMSIGTIRVIPTPEPEDEAGLGAYRMSKSALKRHSYRR